VCTLLALSGAWKLSAIDRSSTPTGNRRAAVAQGIIYLIAATLVFVASLVARPIAERRNNWSDSDGDGMLDPMVNGGYDWTDINGGTFLRVWVSIAGPVLLAAVAGARPRGDQATDIPRARSLSRNTAERIDALVSG
jgi:hypothetical protein